MRILVVEDDGLVAEALTKILADQNYAVESACDGEEGWGLIEAYDYDLILLDVMLPKMDGITLCRRLRSQNYQMPVLLLTGRDSGHDKAVGLDAGADDYVVKPFDPEELVARIRALLRRGGPTAQPVLEWGALRLDPTVCEVTWNNKPLLLTSKEYALLELFLRNSRRVFSCSAILEHLWSYETTPSEEAVRTHIKCLRQKFKSAGTPTDLIETVYGIGYRLKPIEKAPVSAASEPDVHQPSPNQTMAAIAGVWERFKDRVYEQVGVLEQLAQILSDRPQEMQNPRSELWQQAKREAHTLAGSLGTFGFPKGSHLAGKVEQLLKAEQPLSSEKRIRLAHLVQQLRQEISDKKDSHSTPASNSIGRDDGHRMTSNGSGGDINSSKPMPLLLVVDRDRSFVDLLSAEAGTWNFRVKAVSDLMEAHRIIERDRPQVVLLDPCVSEQDCGGVVLLNELGQRNPPIPALIFTAHSGLTNRLEVARLGGRAFLSKPVTTNQIFEAVTQVLDNNTPPEARILAVDDDPQTLSVLNTLLTPWGLSTTLLNDPRQFLDTLETVTPDLLILDIEMPHMNGIELCQIVRNDLRWSGLPILFLTAHTDAETVNQVFLAGADDFVSKPIAGPELVNRILNRLERIKLLRDLAEIDPLTHLCNRQKSTQDINKLLHLAKRHKQPLCFAILDLDHFKQINDRYGHASGDEVLRQIGQLLRQSFRHEDITARWGGEEFVISMYGMTRQDGVARLMRLLKQLHQTRLLAQHNDHLKVTFSAGVAEFPTDGKDLQSLYQAADAALYQAKVSGRDRVLPATASEAPLSIDKSLKP